MLLILFYFKFIIIKLYKIKRSKNERFNNKVY
ncbi:hypothetical protein [Campylobacter phage CJLB-14]|nr:hypothetical protein [Campylobacter phage CJLB-14]